MSEQIREQISALLDGELPEAERRLLLERLERDPALRLHWSRYQLISDAVHQTLPPQIDLGFADRVMAVLDEQPEYHRQPVNRLARAVKPLAGLAVAASVAVVAVLAVQQARTPDALPGAVQVAEKPPAPTLPASADASAAIGVPVQDGNRLNAYLVNHSEYAASGGMPGMSPYVRIVGYDQE